MVPISITENPVAVLIVLVRAFFGRKPRQGRIPRLLPQKLPDGAQLEVCYALVEQHGLPVVTEIVTCDLPLTALDTWPEGKVVRYKITLNVPSRGVSDVVAQVYDWDDSGNDHNEELMPHD